MYAAVSAVVITAGLGGVGAAGADEVADDATIAAPANATVWLPPEVSIQPDDTVTWTFESGGLPHNVRSSSSNWSFAPTGNSPTTTPVSYTFPTPGRYDFVCSIHPGMDGTVIVGNATPTPTPTQTATPTPTPTPTPAPGGGSTTTPAPSPTPDTVKPTVQSVKLTAARRAVRVRFRLSEPATVTIKVKRRGSRRVLKSARLQAPAGMRSVTLRSKKLKRGRYTVEIQARDAFGNRSSVARKSLRLRR